MANRADRGGGLLTVALAIQHLADLSGTADINDGTLHSLGSDWEAKGVHRFKILATNALADVKRLPEGDPTKVRRSLTAEEVESIFKHSRPEMVPVWRLYATTGMRKAEMVALRFTDIDFADKSITIRGSVAKSKRSRRVLLDDTMMAALTKLRDEAADRPVGWDREHVFINHAGRPHRNNLLRKFYATCKRPSVLSNLS